MSTSDTAMSPQIESPRRRRGRPATTTADPIQLRPSTCRRRRLALGLSTYELAQRARLDEQTVVRFEVALGRPRPITVIALHKALSRLERPGDRAARRAPGRVV
ncbi:MAG: helix-turn-helix transcriptional regulator [Alphaproteobacteria bacterium]|nr:helix-turn-helix transcriptional regulator [Alphaproteobacteria bacterium]MBU1516652.1 helix-turn-helix transcriptional regulator [Alphaproteobacteria bacterium]MBU2094408.1 helix-turn-helix transcriptional regulator [Alphaproteobacteria bacterium]MBU2153293.1 helix-turn-helix transcriptional regulator [Alphaproteobacteria bacterium]MBU2307579.1 helix-turn-helix transcriptional regulator [Alphaproteobacteria bacterium]